MKKVKLKCIQDEILLQFIVNNYNNVHLLGEKVGILSKETIANRLQYLNSRKIISINKNNGKISYHKDLPELLDLIEKSITNYEKANEIKKELLQKIKKSPKFKTLSILLSKLEIIAVEEGKNYDRI